MAGIRRRFPVVYFSMLSAFVSIIYFLHHRDFGQRIEKPKCKAYQTVGDDSRGGFFGRFSVIFYILGFSASSFGLLFLQYHNLIRMLGGIFVVVMGLFLLGVFRPAFMMKERRFSFRKGKIGLLNSMLVGMIFAAGWTPCIGPIFGTIAYANFQNPDFGSAFMMITAYSLGFAIPFLLMAFFIGNIRPLMKYSNMLMKVGGALMIVIGILLYTDNMIWINIWYSNLTNLF